MSDIIVQMLQAAGAAGLSLAAIGAGLGAARAAWQVGGRYGSHLDYQRDMARIQADFEKARAVLESASVDRVLAARPASIHYAPHTTVHSSSGSDSSIPSAPALNERAASVLSFAELLNTGAIGPGNPLLLGIGSDGEIPGAWTDLYSTALGGLPGTGKTTSQRFFACQTALHGARFIVCDPHYGTSDDSLGATLAPLRSRFVCDVLSDEKSILDGIRYADDEGKRRLSGAERSPLIVWIDELTALLSSSIGTRLSGLLEEIARQYRKVGVYLSASGQTWLASRSGGSSALRDSFASVIAHRMKRNQARLLLPSDDAAQAERLQPGQAILYRTSGHSEIVTIPNTTSHDVVRVAGLLGDTQPTIPHVASQETHAGGAQEAQKTSPESYMQDVEAVRILAAFSSGSTVRDIAIELAGSGSGRKYQEASVRVQEVIRGAISC